MATRKPLLFILTSALLLLSIFKFSVPSRYLLLSSNQAYTCFLKNLALYKSDHVYIDIDSDYYQKIIRQSRPFVIKKEDMVVLNGKNFSQFMIENYLVMTVGSELSQCTYWSRQPAATIDIKSGEVVLVKVDAYKFTETELRKKTPTIHFYRDYDAVHDATTSNSYPIVVESYNECGREVVMTWVKRKMRLGVYNISTMDDAKRILVEETKFVLGFLSAPEGPESEELAAASKLLSDINFYQTTSADVPELFHTDPHIKRPALILLHTLARKYSIFDGQFTRLAIADFVSKIKLPLVVTFTVENSEQIFQNPMKQLWLFAPTNGSEKVKSTFEDAANAFEGKLLFIYVEMNRKGLSRTSFLEFGIFGNAPRIITYRKNAAKQHVLNGELNLISIKSFGEDFLEESF